MLSTGFKSGEFGATSEVGKFHFLFYNNAMVAVLRDEHFQVSQGGVECRDIIQLRWKI